MNTSKRMNLGNLGSAVRPSLNLRDPQFRSLWNGVTGTMMREGIYSTLRVNLYEPFKYMLGGTDRHHTPYWIKVCAGGLAGLVGLAMADPTDMIKTKMQAEMGAKVRPLSWHV